MTEGQIKESSKHNRKIFYVGLITFLIFLLFWKSGGFLSSVAIVFFFYSVYFIIQTVLKKGQRKRNFLITVSLLLISLLIMPQDTTQQNNQNSITSLKSSSEISKKTQHQKKKVEQVTKIPKTKKIEPVVLYKVSDIIDGDTIKVKIDNQEKTVRLIGIDAPEIKDLQTPRCYGKEAAARIQHYVQDKQVSLKADKTQDDKDKYGRLLRYVYTEDKTNVNKTLVSEGFAKEYTYKKPYENQKKFKKAQKQAKKSDRGLWAANTCNGNTKQTDPKVVKAQQDAKRKAEQEAATREAERVAQQAAEAAETERQRQAAAAAQEQQSSGGIVKMSNSGICHAPGTTYYDRTKNFTPYDSLSACISAGGRMPLR